MKKYVLPLSIVILVVLSFSGCTNKEDVQTCLEGHTYGFWGGLWHGFIAPIDLIGMLFYDNVSVYAENNNGFGYALGFLIGSGGWGFFGSRGARAARKRKWKNS